jgi:phospholipid N-methyltransferase
MTHGTTTSSPGKAHSAGLFLRQFWRSPRSIGAAFPSSRALGEAMLAPIDFTRAQAIVEFGPGTGPFTRLIAERLRPGQNYVGIELNDQFFHRLKAEFPHLAFEHASVEDLSRILAKHGIGAIDAIVCGLPWASLPAAFQARVFAEIERHLAPGGVFVTFAYLQGLALPAAWALRRRLRTAFASVGHTRIVWGNLPPAFAYVCRK